MITRMKEQPITFFKSKKEIAEQSDSPEVPAEIMLEQEVREKIKVMKGSGSRWAWVIADAIAQDKEPDQEFLAELLLNQKHELPVLVTAVMERTCNLQCSHCLYQDEKSSAKISEAAHLGDRIIDIVSQMPSRSSKEGEEYSPQFLSCGRILRPWHLDVFTKLHEERPDVELGVIDNGTFTSLLAKWPNEFKFDWMDISIDGIEESHNKQRQSSKAFAQAIEGLKRAREVTKSADEGGRVSSLLTLTKINANDIEVVADTLLGSENGERPLVDQFQITTVGPTNAINAALETNADDFRSAWEQLKRASRKYNTEGKPKIMFAIYRIEDIEKLAEVVGEGHFLEAFSTQENDTLPIKAERNFLYFDIDGIQVQYQPLSIWTPEEFLIEADGVYRTAYEGKFTLEELRSGIAKDGSNTAPYTFEPLTATSNFRETFERAVDTYWIRFGKQGLKKEMETFKRIRAKAQASK